MCIMYVSLDYKIIVIACRIMAKEIGFVSN